MENEMEKLTDGLTAYVCDTICKHLASASSDAELLAACTSCKLADYRTAIEGQYNKVNDFEYTQCARLLVKIKEMEDTYGIQTGSKDNP